MDKKIKVAALVENHPYDVVSFQKMLESFTDCECYVQPVDLFVQDEDNRDSYDTVLYFSMNWDPPAPDTHLYKYLTENMGETKQGIIILHHALLSFQEMDLYTDVCGLKMRGAGGLFRYTQNETVNTYIADKEHFITKGLEDFAVVDEAYIMGEPEEEGNHTLLTTDNPNSIQTIGWTRQYKNSRVFTYASGHDDVAWSNESFRTILHRGIQWTANL